MKCPSPGRSRRLAQDSYFRINGFRLRSYTLVEIIIVVAIIGTLAELTKQLLAFSRKQVLAPKLMDMNIIVSGLGIMLQRLIGESINLDFKPAKQLGLVKVDLGQIEQVIVNLVVNARDALPHGGRITLETAAVDLEERDAALHPGMSGGPHVMLKVTDTGTGMDDATRSRIFEPFFTTKEPGKGTGLGLATVYGIVAQSGGSIQVESELGRGTTFMLHFPVAEGTIELAPSVSLPVAGGHETVLLVEDEHDVRILVEQILEDYGYVVLSAGRPSDALRIAELHLRPIHLLLTDMVMPEMSGIALGQRLSAVRPELVVLQMSGYAEYCGNEAKLENAPSAFVQKPFTPDTLARAVRAVLDTTVTRRWRLE